MNKAPLTTFYIVRHGETEWNVKGLIQGHEDSPLTKNGIKQTKALAKSFKNISIDVVFSSDLLRSQKTAEIIALEKKLAIKLTKVLRERNFGKYEGKEHEALREFDILFEKLSEEEKFSFTNSSDIESDEQIVTRLITFLREAAITHPGKTVLVVTHGGIMRAFLIHLGIGTYQTLTRGAIKNAAYIKLLSDGVDFFIKETKGINKSQN